MHQHLNLALLAVGLTRVGVWATVAAIGWHTRRALVAAFGTLATLNSVVFSIANAHGNLPTNLVNAATVLALPLATLMLLTVLTSVPTKRLTDHWTL